jgi:hypothetical protein
MDYPPEDARVGRGASPPAQSHPWPRQRRSEIDPPQEISRTLVTGRVNGAGTETEGSLRSDKGGRSAVNLMSKWKNRRPGHSPLTTFFMAALGVTSLAYVYGIMIVTKVWRLPQDHDIVPKKIMNESAAKDADGCYHIFVDGGANIGVHGRFLYEPNMYPDAKVAHKLYNYTFGPPETRDNRDFCVFELEANPAHYPQLKEKEDAYARLGWRYKVMNVGLSDRYETITFYGRNDEYYNEWGFSTKKFFDGAKQVDVPTIRLSSWLKEHVLPRKLPSKVYGQYNKDGPVILVKLDIEGSEFVVLPDLISSGVFCDLDLVFGELHGKNAPYNFPGLDVPLQTQEQAKDFERVIVNMIKSLRMCKASFLIEDDESYVHDGVPLPTANQSDMI